MTAKVCFFEGVRKISFLYDNDKAIILSTTVGRVFVFYFPFTAAPQKNTDSVTGWQREVACIMRGFILE